MDLSSLLNIFEESIQVNALDQHESINDSEQSESISISGLDTLSSIESQGPNLSTIGNDESLWFDDETAADDANVWTTAETESLFKAMCDDVDSIGNSSVESVDSF